MLVFLSVQNIDIITDFIFANVIIQKNPVQLILFVVSFVLATLMVKVTNTKTI